MLPMPQKCAPLKRVLDFCIIMRIYLLCSFSTVYKCWRASPEERPSFEELTSTLERRLEAVATYMELKMVLETPG